MKAFSSLLLSNQPPPGASHQNGALITSVDDLGGGWGGWRAVQGCRDNLPSAETGQGILFNKCVGNGLMDAQVRECCSLSLSLLKTDITSYSHNHCLQLKDAIILLCYYFFLKPGCDTNENHQGMIIHW